jgi:hypothetical protein
MNTDKLMELKQEYLDLPDELVQFAENVNQKRKVNMEKIIKTNWRTVRTKPDWLANKNKNADVDDKIIGEMRGIFNKINDANYESLVESLFELNITNNKQIVGLVDILLHKIIFEEYNHDVYIYVYKKLMQIYIIHKKDDDDEEEKKIYFRALFLERSQKLFQETLSFTQKGNSMIKDKRTAVNFIHYLGLLYCNNLLTDQISKRCLMDLFVTVKKGNHALIDALTTFVEAINPRLVGQTFTNAISNLKKLHDKPGLEKRYQFKISDTIEILEKDTKDTKDMKDMSAMV